LAARSRSWSAARTVACVGACWVGLVTAGCAGVSFLALIGFLTGVTRGEGLVVFPLILVVSILLCSPGAVAWGFGTFLMRDRRIS
jgi:hypothetical protein